MKSTFRGIIVLKFCSITIYMGGKSKIIPQVRNENTKLRYLLTDDCRKAIRNFKYQNLVF